MNLRQFVRDILNENKLLNKNQVEQLANRFKDGSDELKNQLAIFGLFRQQAPFNQIQDVNQLQSKDQLASLFNQWFEKTIGEMIKTKDFIDNRDLAEKYLRAYVTNINSLGANARPFSVRNIEKELVDIVLNNGWIKENKQKAVGIYEPDDSDVVFKDNDIWIMKGDSKAKCVLYGQGQSWCISRADLNHHTTYRINFGATIYFCMQPKIQGVEHTFVILNYGDDQYGLADQTNQNKRSGGPNEAMSWSKIESEIPNLRGKQDFFEHHPVTDEERRYSNLLDIRYFEDDLYDFIISSSQDIYVNGAKISPVDFARDYASRHRALTTEQLQSLSEDMISAIVEIGYEFAGAIVGSVLNEKQYRRYLQLKINSSKDLTDYELERADENQRYEYIEQCLNGEFLIESQIKYATLEQKQRYAKIVVEKEYFAYDEIFDIMTDQQKKTFIVKRILRGIQYTSAFLGQLTEKQQEYADQHNINKDTIWIKDAIRESLREMILPEAYPESFSMEEFKSITSFKNKVEYANQHLQRLSSGSSRVVFKIDDEKVLKVAKNKKGIDQNEMEIDSGKNSTYSILAEVYDYDNDGYYWVEMELVKPIKSLQRFEELSGFSLPKIHQYLTFVKRTNKNSSPPEDAEKISESEFMTSLMFYVDDFDLTNILPGDFGKLNSYGEVLRDGQPEIVLIDFGLNEDIWNNHYAR